MKMKLERLAFPANISAKGLPAIIFISLLLFSLLSPPLSARVMLYIQE
jgi:hypothetical protein